MRIRTKFFLFLIPLLAAICILIYAFDTLRHKQQALQAIRARSISIAEMAAYSLSPALFFNDTETVDEVFLSARQSKDLIYLVVLDNSGKLVSAYNKDKADKVNFLQAKNNSISSDGMIFNSKAPVNYKERKLGELFIGLSLEELHKEMKRLQRTILLSSLSIFFIGMIIIFSLSTLITGPLQRMTKTAGQIADGDLRQRAEVTSKDEVGQLARSFNTMIDHLQVSYSQLEQAKLSLEQRVEERTKELQNEVADRKKAEEALQEAYQKLSLSVEQLEQRSQERAILSELGDSFQTCNSEKEIYAVSAQFAKKLFPDMSGVLYVHKAIKGLLEAVMGWGEFRSKKDLLELDECWALRRGKVHLVTSPKTELTCPHVETEGHLFLFYMCLPLIAQGETIGLFHLLCSQQAFSGGQSLSEEAIQMACQTTKQLALVFAERMAMALANLRLRETLRLQSIRDSLTGLFNRRFMEETLEKEVYRAQRSGTSLGVIMLDIDLFKQFNDNFGHEAGDVMLQALGQFLEANIRKGDIACRYGGEEFTLILPGASLNVAKERAEFLAKEAKNLNIQYSNIALGSITLSLGISIFPDHGQSGASLLKAADKALLRAKREGRNRVVVSEN